MPTTDAAGTNLAARVTAALDGADGRPGVDQAWEALEDYVADRSRANRDDLLYWLTAVLDDAQAMDLLGTKPPRKGLVYCCPGIGWVTPQERADHRWDTYSDL